MNKTDAVTGLRELVGMVVLVLCVAVVVVVVGWS